MIGSRLGGAFLGNRVCDNTTGGIGAFGFTVVPLASCNVLAANGSVFPEVSHSLNDNLCNGTAC